MMMTVNDHNPHLRSRSSESEYLASCEQLSTGPFSICKHRRYGINVFVAVNIAIIMLCCYGFHKELNYAWFDDIDDYNKKGSPLLNWF